MIIKEARENVTERGVAEDEKDEKMLGRGVVTANKVMIKLLKNISEGQKIFFQWVQSFLF